MATIFEYHPAPGMYLHESISDGNIVTCMSENGGYMLHDRSVNQIPHLLISSILVCTEGFYPDPNVTPVVLFPHDGPIDLEPTLESVQYLGPSPLLQIKHVHT